MRGRLSPRWRGPTSRPYTRNGRPARRTGLSLRIGVRSRRAGVFRDQVSAAEFEGAIARFEKLGATIWRPTSSRSTRPRGALRRPVDRRALSGGRPTDRSVARHDASVTREISSAAPGRAPWMRLRHSTSSKTAPRARSHLRQIDVLLCRPSRPPTRSSRCWPTRSALNRRLGTYTNL